MSYNHKLINDLTWSIASPSLVENTLFDHPLILNSAWGQQQVQSREQALLSEDRNPANIQQYFSSKPDFRLGHYFENLVAYWFQIHPDYEILEKNKLIHSTEDNRTLGEIDLLLNDLPNHRIIHLEVAVKFYLNVKYKEQEYWFGTNLNDRLDLKQQRLINHQINISDLDTEYLVDEKHILLKGRLFSYSPTLTDNNIWMTVSDFTRLQDQHSQWLLLEKPYWLSEIEQANVHFIDSDILSKSKLEEIINHLDSHPRCIAQLQDKQEIRRLFICPDNWQELAIKTLL